MVRHAFRVLTGDTIPTRLDRLLGRHGRPAQGAGQRPEHGMLVAPHLDKPLTAGARPVRHACELRRSTTTRACAPSSTPSASTTSSCRRPSATASGRFDATLLTRARALRRGDGDHAAVAARGAASRPIRPSCRCIRGPAQVMQVPIEARNVAPAPSSGAIRRPASASRRRSPAAMPSCNGSRTGRCAGSRSASTTRWPARTSSIP